MTNYGSEDLISFSHVAILELVAIQFPATRNHQKLVTTILKDVIL